jgi:hypothetical protein
MGLSRILRCVRPATTVLLAAIVLCGSGIVGCGQEPSQEEPRPKTRDLGPPLVDTPKDLTKLDPVQSVWIDAKNKQVVMLGEVCKADYPLEFFATLRDRGYESVVVIDTRPSIVHAGLLAVGAKPGHPAQYTKEGKFIAPTGTEVEIDVHWKDEKGKIQRASAREWIRNIKSQKALDTNWVFGGSGFRKGEDGKNHYLADGGDFISVLNLTTATLDLPIRSTSALESRAFEGFVEHLPPAGTPVTILLKPKLDKKPAEKKKVELPKGKLTSLLEPQCGP